MAKKQSAAKSGPGIKKKLYKEDEKGKYLIAGVCAGLAAYTGLNVWLVRCLTIVAGCVFGIGVLLYAVAMVMVPDKFDVLGV
jgi:phage shock protein C